MKTAICAVFKDENMYVKEWADYHLSIGFDKILMFDNESKVPLSKTLEGYENIDIKISKGGHIGRQVESYNLGLQILKDYDWVAFIDIDEFIVLLDESTNIKLYMNQYNDFKAVGLNWLIFGANNHDKIQKSVIKNYTQSAPSEMSNKHVKMIVKPKCVKCVSPHEFQCLDRSYAVNVKQKKFSGPFNEPPILNYKMRVNHYLTRSREDFEMKKIRGSGNMQNRKYNDDFFQTFQEEDVQNFDIIDMIGRQRENIVSNNDA